MHVFQSKDEPSIDELKIMKEEIERKIAEKEANNKPIKEGFLKENLHEINDLGYVTEDAFWLITETQKSKLKPFTLVLKKGTRFVCFKHDGKEVWYDDINYGLENMEQWFADKHLENIKEL